jgi:signal transduction histidine kinase
MSLRIRVLLLTGIFFAALLEIGWIQQKMVERMHQESIDKILLASKYEVAALRAQVAFKKQVQEWKNVLIRGHNPADRAKYWDAFTKEEAHTRELVEEISRKFPASSEIGQVARRFLDEHRRMGENYRASLAAFDDATDLAYRRSDALVRGQDRNPTDLFDTIVDLVAAERNTTIQRTNMALTERVMWSRWYAAGAVGTAMLVLLLAMSHWITKPVNAAIRQAHLIANGNLDVQIKAVSIREVGNLQHALNRMASQLKASYAKLETSNRELVVARDCALESSRLKSQFLANMSHEIRTPMYGVIGMTELLLDTPLSDEQHDMAKTAHASAHILFGLVDEILDFAKIEANQIILRDEVMDLRDLVREIALVLSPQAQAKGLVLDFELAPDLPSAVSGDPVRIRQILVNLLANAIKFTERGSVTCRIASLGTVNAEITLKIEVSDTGMGIPEDQHSAVFETFHQVDGSKSRANAGSGLGLSICKRLVELMGGEIGLESRPGEGSRFWCVLRLTVVSAEPQSGTGVHDDVFSGVAALDGKPRILVVEDNSTNRKLVSALLKRTGYPHDLATNGLEALRMVDEQSYGIILMDCQMPEMDGLEATRCIRAKTAPARGPAIVALTASAVCGDREECFAAGMDDYLSKPVERKNLEAMLLKYS